MIDPLFAGLAIGLAVPLLTGGSYRRLFGGPWAWGGLLVAGLVLRGALALGLVPAERAGDVGAGVLAASGVLLVGFAARNLIRRGMGVVLLGLLGTSLVMVVNRGMPVEVPPDRVDAPAYRATAWYHPVTSDDSLTALGAVIPLRWPVDTAVSFADLVVAVGVVDVVFHASRRRRAPAAPPAPRSEAVSPDPEPPPTPAAPPAPRRERVGAGTT